MLAALNSTVENASDDALRFAALVGTLATLALLYLGFIWISVFTFVALVALPSPLILAAAIFRPSILRRHPLLRGYVALCVALAVASWVFEFVWLAL